MRMQLFRNARYPLFINAWYERLTSDYGIPSIELLIKSLHNEVTWPQHPYGYEVYYLENLREENNKTLLQVRFLPNDRRREFISLFMSLDSSVIQNATVNFSVRGDRYNASKMIEELKSVIHALDMRSNDIEMVVEGFMETGTLRFIRESKISGFVWIEDIHRYIHISENPEKIIRK